MYATSKTKKINIEGSPVIRSSQTQKPRYEEGEGTRIKVVLDSGPTS